MFSVTTKSSNLDLAALSLMGCNTKTNIIVASLKINDTERCHEYQGSSPKMNQRSNAAIHTKGHSMEGEKVKELFST